MLFMPQLTKNKCKSPVGVQHLHCIRIIMSSFKNSHEQSHKQQEPMGCEAQLAAQLYKHFLR